MIEKGIGKVYRRHGKAVFSEVPLREFGKVMLRLRTKGIEHISDITGYDNGREIELIYHFTKGDSVISIKTRVGRKDPVMKSIMDQFPGAELYERECFEMFGVRFDGNPNLRRMLLGQESPVTPLRKDAKLEREGVDDKGGA